MTRPVEQKGGASGEWADALAKLAEIPPAGSEERDLWLEAAEQYGFMPCTGGYIATTAGVLTLMSEARKQGQRDFLAAALPAPVQDGSSSPVWELERLARGAAMSSCASSHSCCACDVYGWEGASQLCKERYGAAYEAIAHAWRSGHLVPAPLAADRESGTGETLQAAVAEYLAALDAEPEKDCWDTETGEEEPGAQKFASDWSWSDYHDARNKSLARLRAALATLSGQDPAVSIPSSSKGEV